METNAYRKRKSKRNAAPWQGQRVQAEGLPTGWLLGKKTRSQGRGYNKYYIQPGTGRVFKSRKEVERFLEQQDLGGASNERMEDTPRRELDDASEDGQIDPYEEIENLRRQLQDALNEKNKFEVNCVHLEKCLHEARKEARTHLCAANSKASDYSKLRGSTLKIRSLFERLKSSVSSADVSSFADSLQSLSQSLTNSANDGGDDGTAEFRECVHMLAKKVGILARHRAESEALVNTLYLKHQSEKQANKEKISIGRLELHEIAAFVLNAAGYYTAINRNCSHYYLSPESAALYADSFPHNPTCIVGQIVHMERQTVKPTPPVLTDHNGGSSQSGLISGPTDANPYGLAVGCEFFVVTVAMLPDTTVHPPPPAAAS